MAELLECPLDLRRICWNIRSWWCSDNEKEDNSQSEFWRALFLLLYSLHRLCLTNLF